MKKIISAVLAIILVATMLPMDTRAVEGNNSEREELLALAFEVFPEYTDIPQGNAAVPFSLPNSTNNTNDIAFSETRTAPNGEEITFVQYASGQGMFIYNDASMFKGEYTDTDLAGFSGGTNGTASIKVVCNDSNYPAVLYLKNVKFTIFNSGYDQIQSMGTISFNNTSYGSAKQSGTTKYRENSAGYANFTYSVTFYYRDGIGSNDPRNMGFRLSVFVGGDHVSVQVN